jgi:hypothetical protein
MTRADGGSVMERRRFSAEPGHSHEIMSRENGSGHLPLGKALAREPRHDEAGSAFQRAGQV